MSSKNTPAKPEQKQSEMALANPMKVFGLPWDAQEQRHTLVLHGASVIITCEESRVPKAQRTLGVSQCGGGCNEGGTSFPDDQY